MGLLNIVDLLYSWPWTCTKLQKCHLWFLVKVVWSVPIYIYGIHLILYASRKKVYKLEYKTSKLVNMSYGNIVNHFYAYTLELGGLF